jgi:hypothetical protein
MMQRAFEMFRENPKLVPVAPMLLYRTLGANPSRRCGRGGAALRGLP